MNAKKARSKEQSDRRLKYQVDPRIFKAVTLRGYIVNLAHKMQLSPYQYHGLLLKLEGSMPGTLEQMQSENPDVRVVTLEIGDIVYDLGLTSFQWRQLLTAKAVADKSFDMQEFLEKFDEQKIGLTMNATTQAYKNTRDGSDLMVKTLKATSKAYMD